MKPILPVRFIRNAGEYQQGDRHLINRNSRGRTVKWSRQTVTLACDHQVTLIDQPQAYPRSQDNQAIVACAICYSEGKTT